MKDKKSQIRALFSDFKCEEFYATGSEVRFKCNNIHRCNVDESNEPIWTPSFGDENAEIMLVGEAPSTGGGTGARLGGYFKDLESRKKIVEFVKFRDFFYKELGYVPYFTDLVKCGPKNTKEKATIKRRAEFCGHKYLLKEIEIIRPKSIYCIGRISYDWLGKLSPRGPENEAIELKWLIHYSKQAGLPLSHEDKEMIWKWQLQSYGENLSISSLSYFNPDRSKSIMD